MPRNDEFKFFLYRINKIIRSDMFADTSEIYTANDDDEIKKFLAEVCISKYDIDNQTTKSLYSWSLRGFTELSRDYSCITLSRSEIEKESPIVTSDSIIYGNSVGQPPAADTITILFYWPRHIAIIENHAGMTTGETWLKHFEEIVENAKLFYPSRVSPSLEAIPTKGSIIKYLETWDRVFRFRVKVRLPNPELSRWAKKIYDEMLENNIQEYLQDMYSPIGLNVGKESRVYGTAALAELAYKQGHTTIKGQKDGKEVSVEEGKTAINGKIDQIKSLIRGLQTNAKSRELPRALERITDEINHLFPTQL